MKVDIHGYEKRAKREFERLNEIREEDRNDILKFKKQLLAEGITYGRIMKYLYTLRSISSMLNKPFRKVNKDDMVELVGKIESNEKYSEWTKSDFKKMLKRFYKWLSDGEEYPKEVKWIKTSIKNNKILPEKILTKEEVERLAEATENLRDRAFILVLYSSGCRIGELLPITIKDIQFDDYGCIILVSGKTGPRRVRIIDYTKDFVRWLDSHPLKDNPNAFVWVKNNGKNEMLSYASISSMLRRSKRKSGITKKVNPHAFRHARATRLSKNLSEAVMKEHFGWTQSSKMAAVYNHLSGKDVDEALLKLRGFKPKKGEVKSITTKNCLKCGEINSILSQFCKKCNSPLDLKVAIEIDKTRKEFDDFVKDFLIVLANKNKSTKKLFVKMVKERGLEDLLMGERMKIGQKILLEFKNGKLPKQLIIEGWNKNTVYKYWKIYKNWKELNDIISERLWNLIFESS